MEENHPRSPQDLVTKHKIPEQKLNFCDFSEEFFIKKNVFN